MLVFEKGGKTGGPGEKTLVARTRANNKLNPHMTPSPGIEPGPRWWEQSALTTAPSLLQVQVQDHFFFTVIHAWVKDFKIKRKIKEKELRYKYETSREKCVVAKGAKAHELATTTVNLTN